MDWTKVFCDETENFRRPAEPAEGEAFTLLLRGPQAERLSVFLCTDRENEALPLTLTGTEGIYSLYSVRCPGVSGRLRYFFQLTAEAETRYYGRNGLAAERESVIPFSFDTGFCVPDWARGAVWYQIFVDRFRNGDSSNDVLTGEYVYIQDIYSEKAVWDSPVQPLDVHRFYGGDLAGVLEKLDYLASLGVDVLYLNPVFVSPSNHKYDAQDYGHVDPHFGVLVKDEGEYFEKESRAQLLHPAELQDGAEDGEPSVSPRYICRTTEEDNLSASDALLAGLIEEAKRRGLRVVLDGVFNHCGSFHKWMDRSEIYRKNTDEVGAWWDEKSKFRQYFRFTDKNEYEGWWDHSTLPKLNIDGSEELTEELCRIGRRWLAPPFGADGWRLDVAADVGHTPESNHAFWKRFRQEVRTERPESVLLAEHYGDPSPWLEAGEWDGVMNYDAFLDPVSWFLTGMEKHSDRFDPAAEGNGEAFFGRMRQAMSAFPRAALECSLNELDNHDHSRFLTRTSHTVGRLKQLGERAAEQGVSEALLRAGCVMQMTWPGAPGIYYGDETGLCGFTDPDSRRPYPWSRQNYGLIDFYSCAVRIHKKYPVFTRGSLLPLYAEQGLIAYGSFLKNEFAVTVICQSAEEKELTLDLRLLTGTAPAEAVRVLESTEDGYNAGQKPVPTPEGRLRLRLSPRSAVILTGKI